MYMYLHMHIIVCCVVGLPFLPRSLMQDIPCVLFTIFSSDNDICNGFRAKHMYARHIICDYDWSEHCLLCPIYGIIVPYVLYD